jgi:oxygen-independent coproporphyrinogen-3 oxidase
MSIEFCKKTTKFDPNVMARLNRPVPRYTSYPTAPHFYPFTEEMAKEPLSRFDKSDKPLSLYLHIPFCKTMCLFCACSVILNRRPERQAAYVDLLCREIELLAAHFSSPRRVTQLHFGGGTPTSLTALEFEKIFNTLHRHFLIDEKAERSVEIDPRTVFADKGEKLRFLAKSGINRVSFGVQDLDPCVQEAVRRRQTEEMTVTTLHLARECGFDSVNVDLIYGLPFQTKEKFQRTARRIAELKPDRIAFFSYAKVPWLKIHQKSLPEKAEPSQLEKIEIYLDARTIFLDAGYEAIGMDHFALSDDELSHAYRKKTLFRNFQGYSCKMAEDLLGLGVTSIGKIEDTYLQNTKTLEEYAKAIEERRLPISRGYSMSEEDKKRYWVIQTLMCDFELKKEEFAQRFGVGFESLSAQLGQLIEEGLLEETPHMLRATDFGHLFIRSIASAFDAYLHPEQQHFSKI